MSTATQARVAKRAAVPAKRTPARNGKARSVPAEPESDVEVVSTDEEAGTFTVRLFGEPGPDGEFLMWSDVNFMMLLIAYGGEGEDLRQLSTILKSLFVVDEDDDAVGVWGRFVGLLAKQRGMGAERSMRFINDVVAAAGKDQQESSDD